MNYTSGQRCFHDINSTLGGVGKAKPGSAVDFFFPSVWKLTWVTAEAGYQSSEPPSHFKVFSARTAPLLGPVWHFSAHSLWGCNINKASLKVHQLLKLSRSLPITVTTQCVQHKNMFSWYNGQQTFQKAEWAELVVTLYVETQLRRECPAQRLHITSKWHNHRTWCEESSHEMIPATVWRGSSAWKVDHQEMWHVTKNHWASTFPLKCHRAIL